MSIKKSLLALVAAAMATMAFASPAMATTADGVLRDHVAPTEAIKEGTVLHTIGWARFTTGGGSLECHVTSNIQALGATGGTGSVTQFTVPDTTKCTGTGLLKGCTVKTDESKNLPYHATVTDNGRIDITGNATTGAPIEIHNTYTGCLVKTTLLKLKEVTLTPLTTGKREVTGTANTLGETAGLGQTIAGFEIDGFTPEGKVKIESSLGTKSEEELTAVAGEFELTEGARCTYEITEK